MNKTITTPTISRSYRDSITLQNLYSWKEFYTKLGTPNRASAKQVQDQIEKLLQTNES
jgi:hypothetical protein